MSTSKPDKFSLLEDELKRVRTELDLVRNAMDSELRAAAAIQQALLPMRSPLIKGLRTAWRFVPSGHLGGDSLNIFLLNERNLGFYVLDVSGHGLAASLLSVAVSHFLSPFSELSFLRDSGSRLSVAMPSEVIGRLNLQFASHPEITQFFTLFYGVLNTVTLELVYASAGHPPPLLISEGREHFFESTGLPVGVDVDAEYDDRILSLQKGDRLYLYSDGLIEARSGQGDLYGEERLTETLRGASGGPLSDSLDTLLASAQGWSAPQAPDDDISLLALESH